SRGQRRHSSKRFSLPSRISLLSDLLFRQMLFVLTVYAAEVSSWMSSKTFRYVQANMETLALLALVFMFQHVSVLQCDAHMMQKVEELCKQSTYGIYLRNRRTRCAMLQYAVEWP